MSKHEKHSTPVDDTKVKKVTTACDNCRTKRQKCDGAQPACSACVESRIPCTFSRQARRRGPPLGYLRHVEVRLHVGDAFMGMIMSELPDLVPELLQRVKKFAQMYSSSPTPATTNVWDDWTANWRDTEIAHDLDTVSAKFATPVSRPENESPLRTTVGGATGTVSHTKKPTPAINRAVSEDRKPSIPLDSPHDDERDRSSPPRVGESPYSYNPSTSNSTLPGGHRSQPHPLAPSAAAGAPAPASFMPAQPGAYFAPDAAGFEVPWSSEHLNLALADLVGESTAMAGSGGGLGQGQGGIQPSASNPFGNSLQPSNTIDNSNPFSWMGGGVGVTAHQSSTTAGMPAIPDPFAPSSSSAPQQQQQPGQGLPPVPFSSNLGVVNDTPARPTTSSSQGGALVNETDSVRYEGTATGMHSQALEASYTGSFWRKQQSYTLDDSQGHNSDKYTKITQMFTHPSTTTAANAQLPPADIQVYLAQIYLQDVHPVFPILSRSSILSRGQKPRSLVLALCAYCAYLSPSLGLTEGQSGGLGGGEATKIAAEMWYEQARSMVVNTNVRRPADIETIQTLVFLTLRDQGRGKESQAWLLMGLVVRLSMDLGLHLNSSHWAEIPEDIKNMRRRLWGVVCIMDLLISLQLGRPSCIWDAHWASEIPRSSPPPPDAGHMLSLETMGNATPEYFAYTSSLCQIIARINYRLYLGSPLSDEEGEKRLNELKVQLDAWHEHLPSSLRAPIGHQASLTLPVLDVNLLYHVAVILLYRPFRTHPRILAYRTSVEAATTFNVLLSFYRNVQRLGRSNPHLIYLIFTGAIAHLSGIRAVKSGTAPAASLPSAGLSSQYNLLNCVEALKEISVSWPLAERCHRIMTGLMDAEGLLESPAERHRLMGGFSGPAPPTPVSMNSASVVASPQIKEEGSGSKRPRAVHHHPYLSRSHTAHTPRPSLSALQRDVRQSSAGHVAQSQTPPGEPDSPSSMTAASLLSLASSNTMASAPVSAVPSVSFANMSPPPNVSYQPPPQPPPEYGGVPATTSMQYGADPYLVDFDPYSATGWATMEQDGYSFDPNAYAYPYQR